MKVITIGRGEDNQIVLEDNQDLISRQHATLRIHETGRMEIVSTGSNGTFVNGFRIKPNVPHKITRKDVVSFAHVRQLDWALVPDPFRLIRLGIIGLVAVIIVAVAAVLLWPEKKTEPAVQPVPVIDVIPNNAKKKPNVETPKGEEKGTQAKEEEQAVPTKKFPTRNKNKGKEKKEEKQPEEKIEETPNYPAVL